MNLISFTDWIAKESSAATRSKTAAALGLGPDVASVFGHSTPSPWVASKLQGKLKKNRVDYPALPGENPPKPIWSIPERVQNPDYSFDKWIKDAIKKSEELSDTKKSVEDDYDRLDKEIADRLKKDDKEDKDKEDKDKEDKDKEDKDKEDKDKEDKEDKDKEEETGEANYLKRNSGKENLAKKGEKIKPQPSQEEKRGKEPKWVNQKVGHRDVRKNS